MADDDRELTGVGGWLAFLVAVLGIIRPITAVISTYMNLYGDPNVALAYGTAWPTILLFEWLLNGAMIAACWYLAWRLLFRPVPRTVPITIAGLWIVSVAYQLIDLTGVTWISGAPMVLLVPFMIRPLIQGIIFSTIWTLYLLKSERVANTYRRHDEAAVAQVFG
jgi:hypothetical protein